MSIIFPFALLATLLSSWMRDIASVTFWRPATSAQELVPDDQVTALARTGALPPRHAALPAWTAVLKE